MMTPNHWNPHGLPTVRKKGNQENAKARFAAAEKNEAAHVANGVVKQNIPVRVLSAFEN